jgi:predicted flavoprotein YhiN
MSHHRAPWRRLACVCAATVLSIVAATTATAGAARQSQAAWSRAYAGTTLHFIGEAVDVTGHLGGFNFQWAWSSGAAAGSSF